MSSAYYQSWNISNSLSSGRWRSAFVPLSILITRDPYTNSTMIIIFIVLQKIWDRKFRVSSEIQSLILSHLSYVIRRHRWYSRDSSYCQRYRQSHSRQIFYDQFRRVTIDMKKIKKMMTKYPRTSIVDWIRQNLGISIIVSYSWYY